jgi:hypothetical protein
MSILIGAVPRIIPAVGYSPDTPTTVFTGISGSFGYSTSYAGYSTRLIIPPSEILDAIAGRRQLQFTLLDTPALLRNLAVEVQALQVVGAHEYDTLAAPQEILFAGGSGTHPGSNVSDWTTLPRDLQVTDTLVVIMDVLTAPSSPGRFYYDTADGASTCKMWYAAGQQTYDDAVPVGGTWNSHASYIPMITEIQAR